MGIISLILSILAIITAVLLPWALWLYIKRERGGVPVVLPG